MEYKLIPYLVEKGDTVSGLTRKHNISQKVFLDHNPHVTDPGRIHAGKIMIIPVPIQSAKADSVFASTGEASKKTEFTSIPSVDTIEPELASEWNIDAGLDELPLTPPALPLETDELLNGAEAGLPPALETPYSLESMGAAQCRTQEEQEQQKFIFVEQTGVGIDDGINQFALFASGQEVEQLQSCQQPQGRFGPIVETTTYIDDHALKDGYQLIHKIGDIHAVLLDNKEVRNSVLKEATKEFQHNVMLGIVPLLTTDHDERAVAPCRNGYLYIFLNGRLYRELKVTAEPDKTPIFTDSDAASYRLMDTVPDKREYAGAAQQHIQIPLYLNNRIANVEMAFSQFPWPWKHVQTLEKSDYLRKERCEQWSKISRAVDQIPALIRTKSGIANYKTRRFVEEWGFVTKHLAIDELPEMRTRDAEMETLLGSSRIYLEDISGQQWRNVVTGLQQERQYHDSDVNTQLSAPSDLINFKDDKYPHETVFCPSLRGNLLQQWMHPRRAKPLPLNNSPDVPEFSFEDYQLPEPPTACSDCFSPLRGKNLVGIVLKDQRFVADKLLNQVNANIQLLQLLSESVKYHNYGAAAELIHFNCFSKQTPNGNVNPLYLDSFWDARLVQSTGSLFCRIVKREERAQARRELYKLIGLYADLLWDRNSAHLAATDMDAILFQTADKAWPYINFIETLETILVDLDRVDPRLVEGEPDHDMPRLNRFNYSRLADPKKIMMGAIKRIFETASHPYACLAYQKENCQGDARKWAEYYEVNYEQLQQAVANTYQEKSKLVIFDQELIGVASKVIDEENQMTGSDISGVVRRGVNGLEVISIQVLPSLYGVLAKITNIQGEAMTIKFASELAHLPSALSGGAIPFKVQATNGKTLWLMASDVRQLPAHVYDGIKGQSVSSIENQFGGKFNNTRNADYSYEIKGRQVNQTSARIVGGAYRGIWGGLWLLELNNFCISFKTSVDKPNAKNIIGLFSASFDMFLMSFYFSNLTNNQSLQGLNERLELDFNRSPEKLKRMSGWRNWRGGLASVAGGVTSLLLFWDAKVLFDQGYNNAAWNKLGEAGAMATVATASGIAYLAKPVVDRVCIRLLGQAAISANTINLTITVGSLFVSWWFASRAANHSDDSFSLAIKYGLFGVEHNDLDERIRRLEEKVEKGKFEDNESILPRLKEVKSTTESQSGMNYYSQLVNCLFMGDANIISPSEAYRISGDFKKHNCQLIIKTFNPVLRFDKGNSQPQKFTIRLGEEVTIPGYPQTPVIQPIRTILEVKPKLVKQDPANPAIQYYGFIIPPSYWQHTAESSHMMKLIYVRGDTNLLKKTSISPEVNKLNIKFTLAARNIEFSDEVWHPNEKAYVGITKTREFKYVQPCLSVTLNNSSKRVSHAV
ncbi:LysM peptidoglycan-binding domain-containing protein [Photobacterium lipolyticum]|nr:LysM peptidoglycan-binding domain-containing protein [Photobacterium lipolyticum]